MWPETFAEWQQQVREEGDVRATAFLLARSYRALPARATDLAEEVEQHGLTQAGGHIGAPGYFTSYAHFRNWVRRCAVNAVHDHFERSRRLLQSDEALLAPAKEPQAMGEDEAERVRQCWDSLAERDRALLQRRFIDEQAYEVLAEDFLPPDQRSSAARAQAIRKQILAARERFWRSLFARQVGPEHWGPETGHRGRQQ